jgi:hypothetical protein
MNELRLFLISHALLSLIGIFVAAEVGGLLSAASFAVGSALMLGNMLLSAYLLMEMIQKKQIALPMTIIISKYSILGLAIFALMRSAWIQKGWFSIGLGVLIISGPLYAFYVSTRKEEDEDVI